MRTVSSAKRIAAGAGIGGLVLILDQATKQAALSRLDPYASTTIIEGLFDLTLVKNPGGVFGLFRDLDPGLRAALFTAVPLLAIGLILVYAWKSAPFGALSRLALPLILGGAVGNLIDRLRFGYVVDFLDVHWRGYHWPAFNVADSAICVGIGMLLIESLRPEPAPAPAPSPDATHEGS